MQPSSAAIQLTTQPGKALPQARRSREQSHGILRVSPGRHDLEQGRIAGTAEGASSDGGYSRVGALDEVIGSSSLTSPTPSQRRYCLPFNQAH